ncbi:MAG TPA: SgcJ/EcaC family oxidoreductase [Bacillales bacterium]|nr:SgcJ/EcaC family oxidoreductase [Bacillales bacterium]
MTEQVKHEVCRLYERLLQSWNDQDAAGMASLFTGDGESIGFDGSEGVGPGEIKAHLQPIFEHHETANYVYKIKDVRLLGPGVAVLRAMAGMVPPGKTDINSELNAHQTMVAVEDGGSWMVALFQNTPAQYHGRPELVEAMTNELREV